MTDAEGSKTRAGPGWVVAIVLGLSAVLGFGWLVVRAQALPTGVVPVVWDHEVCAHCKMHIGEPSFAAQLQLEDGRILNFDDPGCLVRHLTRDIGGARAIYFHHKSEDRWMGSEEVGFVETTPTPMGFGLGAVDRSQAGAIPFAAARAKLEGASEHTP